MPGLTSTANTRFGWLSYLTHATCADLLDDPVVPDGRADHGGVWGMLRRRMREITWI